MTRLLLPLALCALAPLALTGCDRTADAPLGPDLLADVRVGVTLYAVNTFDGTPDVQTFTFGPSPANTPALSVVDGVSGGKGQGVTVTVPAAGGYAGGFVYQRPGNVPLDAGATLTFWVMPDPSNAFTLGIRLQDDDDGDGQIRRGAGDAILADDELGLDVVIRPGTSWRRIVVPVSELRDFNPGVGNGVFDPKTPANGGNGGFVSLALLIDKAPANAQLRFALDEVGFSSGITTGQILSTPDTLRFSARANQTSAAQTVTVAYANLSAVPTATASTGYTATLVSSAGTPVQGSATYRVVFNAPATASVTNGTVTFSSGAASDQVVLIGTTASGPGTTRVYRNFEDGDFSKILVFSATNAGVGVAQTDGATGTGGTRALRISVNPAQTGAFMGFVIPPQVGTTFDASGLGFFSFYLRTSATAANTPLTLEINLHEDANSNGRYDGATDDEFQATYAVTPNASDYTLVTLPMSAFVDDNAVFVGANNGFDFTKLFEIVIAVAPPTGPAYTLDVDDLRFTEFAP